MTPRTRLGSARRSAARAGGAIVAALALGACGGGGGEVRVHDATGGPQYFLSERYPEDVRAGDTVLTRAALARGDSIFHGAIGIGSCVLCHGPFLQGGMGGRNLRDGEWHTGDGSYPAILRTVLAGVAEPGHIRMPPRGGMPLSDADARAVAAYVYWASRVQVPTGSADAPGPEGGGS